MAHDAPQSRNEAILQNILGEHNDLGPAQSRIEAILLAILNGGDIGEPYTDPPRCEIEELLVAIKNGEDVDIEPTSRNGKILLAKIRHEGYTEEAQSRVEALLIEWLGVDEDAE